MVKRRRKRKKPTKADYVKALKKYYKKHPAQFKKDMIKVIRKKR